MLKLLKAVDILLNQVMYQHKILLENQDWCV